LVLGKFQKQWSQFQSALDAIPRVRLEKIFPEFGSLFRRKTFEESMHDCLSQNWIDRYNGARDTQRALKAMQDTVRKACPRFEANALTSWPARWIRDGAFEADWEAEFPWEIPAPFIRRSGNCRSCERRRKRVRGLVAMFSADRQPPAFEEAAQFMVARPSREERLIHAKKAQLDANDAKTDQRSPP
jgi:hypothetical protein